MNELNIPVTVTVDEDIGVAGATNIPVGLDTAVVASLTPHYEGSTEITPGDNAQVLATAGMIVDEDIIVDPIPSNYGHIDWNGSFLLVY